MQPAPTEIYTLSLHDAFRSGGDGERLTVHGRAAAALRDEELVAVGIEDHPDLHLPVSLEADRHAEDRQTVGAVGRAVERVDDPAPARAPTPGAALLGENPVLRECGEQARDDQLLG